MVQGFWNPRLVPPEPQWHLHRLNMLSCPKFIHDGLSKKRKPPEVKVSLILETAMQPYCESFSTKQTHQVAVKTTKPMHKPAAASSFFGSLQEDTSFNGQKYVMTATVHIMLPSYLYVLQSSVATVHVPVSYRLLQVSGSAI